MDEQLMFGNREEFRQWLAGNHNVSKGIWLVFGKAGKLRTIKSEEALEEALCYGWIDGQIISINDTRYMKKFTPRQRSSRWSEKNRKTAAMLIKNGKMTESGMKVIELAKKAGTWDIPQGKPVGKNEIEILTKALAGSEPALTNFRKMPFSVRRTYTAAYLDAKQEETRKRRLEKIIGRLNENKKPM
jgi:uncharacterized protein YdeI (YjbR/CyaY-like superfamily)